MAEIENDDDIILPEGLVVRPVEPVKTQFGAVSFFYFFLLIMVKVFCL